MSTSRRRVSRVSTHLSANPTAGIRIGGGGKVDVKELMARVASWHKYVDRVVPERTSAVLAEKRSVPKFESWETNTYDVVVCGFGAAGASAALDAADAGKKVLLIDRFDGGGSTRRSGGVYYAGGGTWAQKNAGVSDTVDDMFRYLRKENGGAVGDDVIREFCEQSSNTFDWLTHRVKVPFSADGVPGSTAKTNHFSKKTSYPPSDVTLYMSGNESAHPFNALAKPAPRGHRAFGDYLTGVGFFNAFESAVERHHNITVALHTKLIDLSLNESTVKSVTVSCIPEVFSEIRGCHVMLHEIGSGSPFLDPGRQIDPKCLKAEKKIFDDFAKTVSIACSSVVVCTGGFFYDSAMVSKHAKKYEGFMPLGNLGDDGSGHSVLSELGGKLKQMDRCSAWKFVNPPFDFIKGVLVNSNGERVGNEDTYGATFADFLVQNHDSKGWLIVDSHMMDAATKDCMDPNSGLQDDQRMQGLANVFKNRVEASNLKELALKIKAPMLVDTLLEYNSSAPNDSKFNKLPQYTIPLDLDDSVYAINLDMVGNKYWPTPCMSLGGVEVEGKSGQVLKSDGSVMKGVYAAGRTCVGVASNYYVSGLSLGCAVFTGRRAGKHAGGALP